VDASKVLAVVRRYEAHMDTIGVFAKESQYGSYLARENTEHQPFGICRLLLPRIRAHIEEGTLFREFATEEKNVINKELRRLAVTHSDKIECEHGVSQKTRINPNISYSFFPGYADSRVLSHCNFMLGEVFVFLNEKRYEKALRWVGFIEGVLWCVNLIRLDEIYLPKGARDYVFHYLGFIQGILWSRGIHTIENLKDHNRPDV